MNFKFPQFSRIAMETIVPNGSPECAVLLTHLLDWNPSKRPTTSDALRYPYFSKLQQQHKSLQSNGANDTRNGIQYKVQQHQVLQSKSDGQSHNKPNNNLITEVGDHKGNDGRQSENHKEKGTDWKLQVKQQEPSQVRRRSIGLKGSATYSELSTFQSKKNLSESRRDLNGIPNIDDDDDDLAVYSSKIMNEVPNSRTSGNSSVDSVKNRLTSVKDHNTPRSRFVSGQNNASHSARKSGTDMHHKILLS